MRFTRLAFLFSGVVISGLLALSLRAQLRTNEKLDALTAALAARPVSPTAAPVAGPVIPRETSGRMTLPPYVIEAPDVLTIEAVVKTPELDVVACLPNQPISG